MTEDNRTKIICKEDENFEHDRSVYHSCQEEFSLDKEEVYSVLGINYFSEVENKYYTICPYCGYLVTIDENILSQDAKEMANTKRKDDRYLLRKNNLKSELIYLDSITPKTKILRR